LLLKDSIEKSFGKDLVWQRLENKKASRIAYKLVDVNITNKDDWNKIKEFLCESMIKFEKAIKEPLKNVASNLNRN